MAKSKQIGAVIGLEGEAKYKQSIANVVMETQKLDAEAKLLDATFAGQKNTLAALEAQHKNLSQALDTQKRKVTETEKALQHAREDQKRFNDEMEAAKSALEKAEKALDQMKKSGKASADEIEKQENEVSRLSATIQNSEKNYTTAQNRVTKWETALAKANTEVEKTSQELDRNSRYLDEARNSADHCATSIDKMGREVKEAAKDVDKIGDEAKDTAKDLSEAGKTASVFGGVLAGNLASDAIEKGLGLAAEAGEALKDSMYDLSSASADLAAKTGLSEEAMQRYRDVMTEIKGDNFGESYGDVADVMAEIVQIMGEIDPSAMKNIAESAITLRDTFDMDVNESIRAVDVMMKTMGVDAQTAFDLIAKGAQNGLDRSHELTDNITEYGQLWGQMGFSAQEMFSILENGLDSGAYNLDKVNDYVKEFGVSLADGRIEKNIDKFSDGTKKLFGQWKDGEASARDVFYSVIGDLSEMTDQQEALTIASDTWSALGEDNAMQVITALDDVNTAYSNVQGTMDKLKETKYSDLESAVSQFGASVQENVLTPIAEKALPLITGGVKLATDVIEGVGTVLNPTKEELSAFSQYVEDVSTEIQETNKATKKAVEEAKGSFDAATMDSDAIGVLGDRLMELNSVEQLTTTQKAEMQAIVAKLSESIPELSGAYDDENGKLNKTNEELAALVKNYQNAAIAQAATAATQELVNAQMEATVNKVKAENLRDMLENEIAVWDAEAKLYQRMVESGDYSNDNYRTEALKLWKDALDEGKISLDQYNEAVDNINTSNMDQRMGSMEHRVGELTDGIAEQNLAIKDSEKAIKDCGDEIGVITEAQNEMASEAAAATSKVNGLSEAMGRGMPTDVAEKMVGTLSDVSDAYDGTAEAAEDAADTEEDAAERAAEAARAGADAQREALRGVRDGFDTLRDDIQQATDSKISLFDAFDGGDEMSLEDMQSNIASYADGIRQYYEDLESLSKDVGNGITQEFYQYLSDLGPEGANVIHEITEAWTNGSEEDRKKIQNMMYEQLQALDASEQGAEIQARNQMLIDEAFKVDPPDPSQYDGLFDALNDAIAYEGVQASADIQTAFSGAVEAAQKVGADIPDGIEQSISEGNIDAAINALNGSVQGKLEGLVGIARDAGVQIAPEIAAGIESGDTGAMAAAYDQLISAISENVDTSTLSKVIGDAVGETAPEIEGYSGDVSDAMGSVAQAGADAAAEKQSEFKTAGDDSAGKYVEALRARKAEAAQEAGALASAAQNAIASYRNAFENIGYNMASGVASGINNGIGGVVNAARSMAAQALAAARKEIDSNSPSKKFRKYVGQSIGEGTAFGIRDKASLAGKEATKMSALVYDKATAWLSKYKESHKVSLTDEQYYWQQVVQHVKKGTAAYNNAIKNLTVVTFSETGLSDSAAAAAVKKIESNFGVSRTTTTGNGKNKKTTKKDAESYYSEIYSAASKYLSNMQTINDWSLQAELQYWEAVQAQLKKGTQAWYDAQKQINSAKSDIADAQAEAEEAAKEAAEKEAEAQAEAAEAAKKAAEDRIRTLQNVHSKILSQYKTYADVSAKAEMDYWDIARQQFTEGTDARIEADQAYFEAREEYYDQLAELDEDYAEKKKDIDDELADSIKDLQKTYDDAVKSREQEIKSSMNLFEAWDAEGWQPDKLMANLRTQVEGLQFWEDQLDELAGKGVTQELMDELAEMGPDAAANLWSLNQMTAEQLEEYQKLWQDKNNLAHKQALEDNKNLLKETQDSIADARKTAQDELAKIDQDYRDAVAKLNTGLADGLKSLVTQAKNVGEEIVSSLVDAVRRGMTDVTALVTQANQQAQQEQAAQQAAQQEAARRAAEEAAAQQAAAQRAAEEERRAAEAAQRAAEEAAQREAEIKKLAKQIIRSGQKRSRTLTSSEKKNKSDLWQYIVTNYGVEPTTAMFTDLGNLFGISMPKGTTTAVKNKILEALKKRGLATGTRNIWQDELAWILENAKTEYVVRTADNAILQPMRAGDKVINPRGAENLYDFAADPTKFISTRARDALAAAQEAMQRRQDEMRSQIPELSYGGITRLNRLMESGMQAAPVVNVDNKELVSMMQQMVSGMQVIMGQMQELQDRQIIMDSGALVGALQQPMSRANAAVQRRRNRGTLR